MVSMTYCGDDISNKSTHANNEVYPPSLDNSNNITTNFFTIINRFDNICAYIFSKFPPPTLKSKIISFLFKKIFSNQEENIVSHPSSLILAVNSETLSTGLQHSICANFLKSLTASSIVALYISS